MSRMRACSVTVRGLAALALVCGLSTAAGAQQTYTVDKAHPACADVQGAGTVERPYCTFRYVTTIAKPGDTFEIQAGRYGEGPVEFRRTGTAAAPITYRGVGDVVIGLFTDLVDEDFQASQFPVASYPFIYSIRLTPPVKPSRVYQTFFPDILVDDPDNQSTFVMRDADGPLGLTQVADYVTLSAREGTWIYDAGRLHIHALGHRVPSRTATDFVIATSPSLTVHGSVSYNVFEGLRIPYAAAVGTTTFGTFNRFVNLTVQATGWAMRGRDNVVDGLSISHVTAAGPSGLWHGPGVSGSAMAVYGTGQRISDAHIFHNWNSSISGEQSSGLVIDGLRMHGAPNHCGAYGKDSTIRNAVFYNCQDYFYLNEGGRTVIDHVVTPQGVSFQGLTAPTGSAVVTNSILSGSFGATSLTPAALCTWEPGTHLERNIISTTALIRRCADRKEYPIRDYMAKCAAGTFTGCMTFADNVLVSDDWATVLADGRWRGTLGDRWDVTLVPGSPAIGAATDGLDIGPVAR